MSVSKFKLAGVLISWVGTYPFSSGSPTLGIKQGLGVQASSLPAELLSEALYFKNSSYSMFFPPAYKGMR